MSDVGFIGAGIMGSAMIRHLADAGHAVTVFNRSAQKLEALREAGVGVADAPAALGRSRPVVHLCVTDTAAVEAVVFGADGVLADPAVGGLIVDHSTISADATREFAARAAGLGWDWVDAPVSGGRAGAEAGTLVIFCGGTDGAIERAEPTITPFAARINHMGAIGAGQATKAVNQLIVGASFAVIAEAANLAERNGIDPARLPAALAGGFADSALLQRQLPRMAAGADDVHGAVDVLLKDLDLVADAARAAGAAIPLAALAREMFRLHAAAGRGGDDWVTILDLLRGQRAGVG